MTRPPETPTPDPRFAEFWERWRKSVNMPKGDEETEARSAAWGAWREQQRHYNAELTAALAQSQSRLEAITAEQERARKTEDALRAQRDAALARAEQMQKDGERYVFLRDKSWRSPIAPGPLYVALYDGISGKANPKDLCKVWLRYGSALDAAIDAAIDAMKGPDRG